MIRVAAFPSFWLERGALSTALLPLAWLYGAVCQRRRRRLVESAASTALPCPVVVVGNIFVGGTGKTPVVAWLTAELERRGMRPGIVSRGYRGRARQWPQRVTAHSDPAEVGDETVLLARRTGRPVVAGPDRLAAARYLLDNSDCNVIVSDDGLQHYRLPRTLELVVVDAARGLGNGRLLPAGPLREPPARLGEVDIVLANGGGSALTPFFFDLIADEAVNLATGERRELAPSGFEPLVHAVAGIGHPERFFNSLRARGFTLQTHAFADHHRYNTWDLAFPGDAPVLMTEKDAVKCQRFATGREWYVPVDVRLSEAAIARMSELLDPICGEVS